MNHQALTSWSIMKIVDAHAHLMDEPNYLQNLLQTMDKLEIEKVCISGLGKLFNSVDNSEVLRALKKYPDRVLGAYFLRPGYERASKIKEAHDKGFRMLKSTLPLYAYDDERL